MHLSSLAHRVTHSSRLFAGGCTPTAAGPSLRGPHSSVQGRASRGAKEAKPSTHAPTRLQEQQERWWDDDAQLRIHQSRAASASDWEEERGRGLTEYRGGEVAWDARGNGWGNTGYSRQAFAPKRQQQQQQQQQQEPAVRSSVRRVWQSPDWQPARGRRRFNEETDVDSDTDDVFTNTPPASSAPSNRGAQRSSSSSSSSANAGPRAAVANASSGSRGGGRPAPRRRDFDMEGEGDGEVDEGLGEGDGAAMAAMQGSPQGGRDLSRSVLRGEALYGVHPILNALLQSRRKPYTLYMVAGMDLSKRKDARAVRQVLSLAQERRVSVSRVSRHVLNTLSADRVHQGLVLDCSPLSFTPLDKFPSARDVMRQAEAAGMPPPVWVALDEVLDPQNFGAILRSGWCLGAAGMLVSAKNCAPLSPAVSKASAGAMEAAEVHAARVLRNTLVDAAEAGWQVLGAAGDAGAQSCQDVPVDKPTIIVLGNEGHGLRTNIRRVCTGLVRVDMGMHGQGFSGLGASVGGSRNGTGSSVSNSGSSSYNSSSNSSSSSSANGATSSGGSANYWGGNSDTDSDDFSDGPRGSGAPTHGAASPAQSRGVAQAGVDSLNVSVATGILLHSLTAAAARHARASKQGREGS